MKVAFDPIAIDYDLRFSLSPIGKIQRSQVYKFLTPWIHSVKGNRVLDLGCGTGEDAIWFANQNFSVTAIDSSSEMIKVAREKSEGLPNWERIQYEALSIDELHFHFKDKMFDLVFSNFGALNCVDPSYFSTLARTLSERLDSNGYVIFVIINNFCLWETLYFLYKTDLKNILRRKSRSPVFANLNEETKIRTWYYSPESFGQYFNENFTIKKISPIGFMVPPSYFNFFQNNKNSFYLNVLERVDQYNPFHRISAFASDHFIICMQKK